MNIVYFITHASLGVLHAELCFRALLLTDIKWDALFVYNTHQDELSNELLLAMVEKTQFPRIEILSYNHSSPKNLANDFLAVKNHAIGLKVGTGDKVLILKSDYVLSKGFSKAFRSLPDANFIWTLPTANAKEFVSPEKIQDYATRENFVPFDEITYYRGSDLFSPLLEAGLTKDESDPSILFVSHNVKRDFNCHVISGDVLQSLQVTGDCLQATWGGLWDTFSQAYASGVNFIDLQSAFAVHVFHEVISKNRSSDRGDKRKCVMGQRY